MQFFFIDECAQDSLKFEFHGLSLIWTHTGHQCNFKRILQLGTVALGTWRHLNQVLITDNSLPSLSVARLRAWSHSWGIWEKVPRRRRPGGRFSLPRTWEAWRRERPSFWPTSAAGGRPWPAQDTRLQLQLRPNAHTSEAKGNMDFPEKNPA